MLDEKIPKLKYIKDAPHYPKLEDRAIGMCIPLLWGHKHNITPVCIDTDLFKFKIMARTLSSIDAVYVDEKLYDSANYTTTLAIAQLIFINTPFLSAAMPYYLVLEGTFAISLVNYLQIVGDPAGTGSPGPRYEIADGAWTSVSPIAMYFEVWGKDTLEDSEEKKVDYPLNGMYGTWIDCDFRDNAARTRVAQKFVTPAGAGFYVTKVFFAFHSIGTVSGNIRAAILSAYTPVELQVGTKSDWILSAPGPLLYGVSDYIKWTYIEPEKSKIRVDATGLLTNVADIIQDIYTLPEAEGGFGGDASDLNAADFVALKAARTEILAVWLDKETSFQEIIEKMEAGQLFKFLPNLAGEYTVKYYVSGDDPGGAPHYRDEDFISFTAHRNLSSVYYKCKVKYDEDPTTQDWVIQEETSEIARFFYRNKKILEVETYLKADADALQLAEDYLGVDPASLRKQHLQFPQRTIEFELQKGLGTTLLPTQKVKITRSRGDYSGGLYNAVLFRILNIEKKYNTQTVAIMAVLDSLTY